jgi:hypothetical protein
VWYGHSFGRPSKKIANRFLVLPKTKEPVVKEHVREVEPGNVKYTRLAWSVSNALSRVACSAQRPAR